MGQLTISSSCIGRGRKAWTCACSGGARLMFAPMSGALVTPSSGSAAENATQHAADDLSSNLTANGASGAFG